MRKRKLLTDYHHLPQGKVALFAKGVVTSLANNKKFADGPALTADLAPKAAALTQFFVDFPRPRSSQRAEKDRLLAEVLTALHAVATTCNLRYGDVPYDEAALLSTGFELEAERHNRKDKNLPAPTDFKLADGPTDGALRGTCKRPTGAVIVLWRYTTDATLPDEQWRFALGGNDVVLGDFPSGTRIYVKAAGVRIGQTDYTYTPVLSRIVQ